MTNLTLTALCTVNDRFRHKGSPIIRRLMTLERAAVAFSALWAGASALLLSMPVGTSAGVRSTFVLAIAGIAGLATAIASWRMRPLRADQADLVGVAVVAMLIFSVLVGIGFTTLLLHSLAHVAPVQLLMAFEHLLLAIFFACVIAMVPTIIGALLFCSIISFVARLCRPNSGGAP